MKKIIFFFALLLATLPGKAQFDVLNDQGDPDTVQTFHFNGNPVVRYVEHRYTQYFEDTLIFDCLKPAFYVSNPSTFVAVTSDGRIIPTLKSSLTFTQGAITGLLDTLDAVKTRIASKVPGTRTITINSVTFDLSANRTWTLTTSDIAEGSNLYYTNTRSRGALSLTTLGSGAASYNSTTGVLNIPTPTASGTVTSVGIASTDLSISGSPVTSSGNITVNLGTSGISSGTYGRLTVNSKGIATAGKRQEPYSGTTDASGNYTVTFTTAYSVAPNIQANIIGGTTEQMTNIVSVSTTGFTVHAFQRATVLSLALSTATTNISGANIDVLITEK